MPKADQWEERFRKLEESYHELIRKNEILAEENAQLRKLALRCPITGLYNLNYVKEEVQRVRAIKERELIGVKPEHRRIEYVAGIYIDLDRLKWINDTFGHSAGNKALCAIASELKKISRKGDIVAHPHGDEFLIFAMCNDKKEAKKLGERIASSLASVQVELNGGAISVSASVGFSCSVLSPKFNLTKLIDKADSNMLRMKNRKPESA